MEQYICICIAALLSSAITNLIWVVVLKIMSRKQQHHEEPTKTEAKHPKQEEPETPSIAEHVESVLGHYERPTYKDATFEELKEVFQEAENELSVLYKRMDGRIGTIPEQVTETYLNKKITTILAWMNYRIKGAIMNNNKRTE